MKKVLATPSALKPGGVYSVAIEANGLVFLAGQVGVRPDTGQIAGPGIEDQTRQCLANLGAVLRDVGLTMGSVVKVTAFLVDFADFSRFNETYRESFPADPPVRTTVAVAGLASGLRIEIDAVAARA